MAKHGYELTKTVSLGRSSNGAPLPNIEVIARKACHRQLRAAVYMLAAEVELATHPNENWTVDWLIFRDDRFRLYLELADGTNGEAERAMELLTSVETDLITNAEKKLEAIRAISHYVCGNGTVMPQIEASFPQGASYRMARAILYKVAAEVELASPTTEHWIVKIEQHDDTSGRIYLDLPRPFRSHAESGMAVLKKVAGQKGRG